MNELWAELMTQLNQFWTTNSTPIIAGASALVPTLIAIIKTKATTMFKKKSEAEFAEKTEIVSVLNSRLEQMTLDHQNDMRVMGEAFNTAFTGSNLKPETKLEITNTLSGLSGVSDSIANKLKAKTEEIVNSTKNDTLDKLEAEVKAKGSSILSKFLAEDTTNGEG